MDVSEDDIRGLRRFGGSSRSLSDLVDAEEVSRHLGITPRRVLSMARKPFAVTREEYLQVVLRCGRKWLVDA